MMIWLAWLIIFLAINSNASGDGSTLKFPILHFGGAADKGSQNPKNKQGLGVDFRVDATSYLKSCSAIAYESWI